MPQEKQPKTWKFQATIVAVFTKLSAFSYILHQAQFPSAFISQSIRLTGFFFIYQSRQSASEQQIENGECELKEVQPIHEIVVQFPRWVQSHQNLAEETISVVKITAIIAGKEIYKETKRLTHPDTYLWQMETAFIV